MKIFLKILTSFVLLSFSLLAQEFSDSLQNNNLQFKENFMFKLDDLDFRLELQSINREIILNMDPNTQWLWTKHAIASQPSFHSNNNFDNMTLSLYQKYLKDSKFNPMRYVLGAMQTGAAAYLAYKHIKKYGFLKK
jgi:hypothetical protein